MMRYLKPTAAILSAVAVAGIFAWQALADGGGTVRGNTDLADITSGAIQIGDNPELKAYVGLIEGTFANETGDAPLKKARYQAFWVVFPDASGAMKLMGYKIFTAEDGASVVARFDGIPYSASKDGKSHGTWAVQAGTGKYENARGNGKFTYAPTTEGMGRDLLEGEIHLQ